FPIRHHDAVAENIDGLKAKELSRMGLNDAHPPFAYLASADTSRRDQKNQSTMLCGQAVVSRRTAVSNVIRIGDAACEREEVAFAEGIGSLVGWNEKVFSPTCPFQPALAA